MHLSLAGLEYINSNTEKFIKKMCNDQYNCPRWFAIVFPEMLELAERMGLEIEFKEGVSQILHYRQIILETYVHKLYTYKCRYIYT